MAEDYRISLIEIAKQTALGAAGLAGTRGRERQYLARFRAAYRHLAATVEGAGNPTPGGQTNDKNTDNALGVYESKDSGK